MPVAQPERWDVAVVGGANMDYLVRGSRLPKPGETVMGDMFQEAPGGKGANQAVAAARLGARVTFVGRVGTDARGDALIERLAKEGVDTGYALRETGAPTGVALIMVDEDGEKQILTAPGANLRLSVTDVRQAAAAIQAARVVLAQMEVPVECVHEAVRLGYESGARIVLDPARPIVLRDELLRYVDVIKPNATEIQALTGLPSRNRDSARAAAGRLLERGAGAVAVQAGGEGNLLIWREGECWLPRIEVESIDATGAGDAFAAALAVAIAEGRSWEEAGWLASASAALATTVVGAQAGLPRRDQVEALLEREDVARRV